MVRVSATTAYGGWCLGVFVGVVFFLVLPAPTEAAITYVGAASNNTNNAASMSIDISSIGIQDGDLILFFGSCDGNGYDLPTGAGFTLLYDEATGGTHDNIYGYRIASSEPTSYTIDTKGAAGERGIGIVAVYRGTDQITPIDATTTNIGGSNTSAIITSLTPSHDASAVAVFVGIESGNAGSPITTSWPGSLAARLDNVNGPAGTGAASSAGAFGDVIQTTASAVSGTISLTGGSTFWGTMAVVLNPVLTVSPTVTTNYTGTVGASSATVHATLLDTGGADATGHGFAYATDPNLGTGVSTSTLGAFSGTGTFEEALSTLSEDTTYYYRAYATNSAGTGFGTIRSFTTGNSTIARVMHLFEGFLLRLRSGRIILHEK